MEERSDATTLEKVLQPMIMSLKILTSWYIAPIWVFGLGVLLGQPFFSCLIVSIAFGLFAHRVWI